MLMKKLLLKQVPALLILVIGGAVGIENCSGAKVEVNTGRGDATQTIRDVSS